MDNLSFSRMGVLLVVALLVFGPDKLPEVAAQIGRTIRKLRATVDALGSDMRTSLGPEITSLNPKTLLSELTAEEPVRPTAPVGSDAMALLERPVDLSTVSEELAAAAET